MKTYETTDYDRFTISEYNRKVVSKSHLESLKKSLKEKNLIEWNPIWVNSDFEIKDGQHRFLACKELKLPIYYFIRDDESDLDMIRINDVVRKWNSEDFENFYLKKGYKKYLHFNQIKKEFHLSTNTLLCIIDGSKRKICADFRNGRLDFDYDEIYTYCSALRDIQLAIKEAELGPIPGWTKTRCFVRAIRALLRHPNYEHEYMLKKIKENTGKFEKKVDTISYIKFFCKIFNNRKSLNRIEIYEENE